MVDADSLVDDAERTTFLVKPEVPAGENPAARENGLTASKASS